MAVLGVCGVRLGSELHRTDASLAQAQHHAAQLHGELGSLGPATDQAGVQGRALDAAVAATRTSLGNATTSLDSTEERLVLDGLDVYALDACLGGVTRALDQASVGQSGGAAADMNAASPSCSPPSPGG